MDVPVQVTVELGRAKMQIRNLLNLTYGSVIELDILAGEPLEVACGFTLDGLSAPYISKIDNEINKINSSSLITCYQGMTNMGDDYTRNSPRSSNIKQQILDYHAGLLSRAQSDINTWSTEISNRLNYLDGLKSEAEGLSESSGNNSYMSIAKQAIIDLNNSHNRQEIIGIIGAYDKVSANFPQPGAAGFTEVKITELTTNVDQYTYNTLNPAINSCNTAKSTMKNNMDDFIANLNNVF